MIVGTGTSGKNPRLSTVIMRVGADPNSSHDVGKPVGLWVSIGSTGPDVCFCVSVGVGVAGSVVSIGADVAGGAEVVPIVGIAVLHPASTSVASSAAEMSMNRFMMPSPSVLHDLMVPLCSLRWRLRQRGERNQGEGRKVGGDRRKMGHDV